MSDININKNSLHISKDLSGIFKYLIEIDEEVKTVLDISENNTKLKASFLSIIELLDKDRVDKLTIEDSNKLNDKISATQKSFNYQVPIHSEFILLFTFLESLSTLYFSYKNQTSDEKELLRIQMTDSRKEYTKFINSHLLNQSNNYFIENKKYFKRLDSKNMKILRNKLIHFYSVDGNIGLVNNLGFDDAYKNGCKLEKQKFYDFSVLSSKHFYGLIHSCLGLLIEEWINDYNNNKHDFNEKIKCVSVLCNNHGSAKINF